MTYQILLSGVHDAKNILFDALEKMRITGTDLHWSHPAQQAIEQVSERLNQMLVAYRMANGGLVPSIYPVDLLPLVSEAVLRCFDGFDGEVDVVVGELVDESWPLDRDLITDVLVNAMENAKRYAKSKILIESRLEDGGLRIMVADDGAGFPATAGEEQRAGSSGIGLQLAHAIAALHERHGRKGSLSLYNGMLGGAVFDLWLP